MTVLSVQWEGLPAVAHLPVRELTAQGVFFETTAAPPHDTRVRLRSETQSASGIVVYVEPDGFGVQLETPIEPAKWAATSAKQETESASEQVQELLAVLEDSDAFACLALPPTSDEAAIRKAFLHQARMLHPNALARHLRPGDRFQAAEPFAVLAQAYTTLRDTDARAGLIRKLARSDRQRERSKHQRHSPAPPSPPAIERRKKEMKQAWPAAKERRGKQQTKSAPANEFSSNITDNGSTKAVGRSKQSSFAGSRVLVVEDEESVGRLLCRYLEQKGFVVILANDGVEGYLAWTKHRPDVCVIDGLMPRMDGFTLIKAARITPALSDTPVLIASAIYAGEEHRGQANALRVKACIAKPYRLSDIMKQIEIALRDGGVDADKVKKRTKVEASKLDTGPPGKQDAPAAAQLGEMLMELMEFSRAAMAFELASKLDPTDVQSAAKAAWSYFRHDEKNLGPVWAALKRAFDIERENYVGHYYRGMIQTELGDFDAAEKTLARAKRLAPDVRKVDMAGKRLAHRRKSKQNQKSNARDDDSEKSSGWGALFKKNG